MKKQIHLSVLFFSLLTSFIFAQQKPYSFTHALTGDVPNVTMPDHDFSVDLANAIAFEEAGNFPIFTHHFDLGLNTQSSGNWTVLENGDRVWRLSLKSKNAITTALFFENFYLPEGSTLHIYSPDKQKVFYYDFENNQGNNLFASDFLKGEEAIIEYYEPYAVRATGSFTITSLAHQFRELAAGNCHVNIICSPEGDNWQDEKKGVCRIYVKAGSAGGWCTGALVNNTAQNCKRYILSASHCGMASSSTDYNSWVFRFNYDATNCLGSDTEGTTTNQFTGATKIADSQDNGGATGSDMLLLEMTATTSPTWWSGVYFNGWTRSATAPTGGGVGIHHPMGANKKVSTFTNTPGSVSWGGSVPSTHWEIFWVLTTNNHGVTEGGSSGSPIYNTNGLIFGTLTGGNSSCTALTAGDAYGKMSYHWTSNGTTSNKQLKPWLDPANTNPTTLNGAFLNCTTTVVTENEKTNFFNVYPNPNNGAFTIYLNSPAADDIEITIYNSIGQKVNNIKPTMVSSKAYTITLENQTNGIYFVEVKSNGKTFVQKVSLIK